MTDRNTIIYGDEYLAYQTDRNWLRKFVRQFYVRHAVRQLLEPIIDFGCGIGEHLSHLGMDSIGLEVNQSSIDYCRSIGLNVVHFEPEKDQYQLAFLERGKYKSMLISHVLEHLDDPDDILRTLARSCERIGIQRIFICVPGSKGYAHDPTHITYIDKAYVYSHELQKIGGYSLSKMGYFPFNHAKIGNFFTHNEMFMVYDWS